jgi:rhomboid protease GluP
LVTANFLHIGFIHLGFNSYALFLFGPQVERYFGRRRFFVLYMLAGIGGSVLSYVGSRALSAGASGAIFGLVGAMTVFFAIYRDAFGQQGRRQLSSLLMITGFNLVWGFTNPGIDNLGHIGGLLVGLALGWAYCPRYQLSPSRGTGLSLRDRYSSGRAVIVTLILGVMLLALTYLGTLIHTTPGGLF